ncbi:hypothetical protein [Tropicimonas sp. IMCC34011]|uniref:hypothetical protein n=1 Tax=Tropicimonas sp. IMCC34011 TaxID=2248759 RepID=UPI000E26DB9E|nr:hypothetical protein [Tropicimonas sp. IMCC34011]
MTLIEELRELERMRLSGGLSKAAYERARERILTSVPDAETEEPEDHALPARAAGGRGEPGVALLLPAGLAGSATFLLALAGLRCSLSVAGTLALAAITGVILTLWNKPD